MIPLDLSPSAPRTRPRRQGRRRIFLAASGVVGLLLVSHLLGLVFGPSHAGSPALDNAIRVRLAGTLDRIVVRASNARLVVGETAHELPERFELRRQSLGLLVVSDGSAEVHDVSSVVVTLPSVAELEYSLDGTSVHRRELGRLTVETHESGLRCILTTDLELYLTGVLEAEMGHNRPLEALKAQAITARSYARATRRRRSDKDFDVYDDTRSQAYRGLTDAPSILTAVEQTKDQVLVLRDSGEILRAYFHSTCGGATRDGHERFRDVPKGALPSRPCDACKEAPLYRWTRQVEIDALAGDGKAALEVLDKSGRGDWKRFRVRRGTKPWRTFDIADLMRAGSLPSPWIERYEISGRTITLYGRGFGHGVGLCQFGAIGLAAQGWKHERILSWYFPSCRIETRPGDSSP